MPSYFFILSVPSVSHFTFLVFLLWKTLATSGFYLWLQDFLLPIHVPHYRQSHFLKTYPCKALCNCRLLLIWFHSTLCVLCSSHVGCLLSTPKKFPPQRWNTPYSLSRENSAPRSTHDLLSQFFKVLQSYFLGEDFCGIINYGQQARFVHCLFLDGLWAKSDVCVFNWLEKKE